MASRKNLKKSINGVCGELLTECFILHLAAKEEEGTKLDNLLVNTLKIQSEFIARISHTEKNQEALFYRKLKADFEAAVNTIIDQLEIIQNSLKA